MIACVQQTSNWNLTCNQQTWKQMATISLISWIWHTHFLELWKCRPMKFRRGRSWGRVQKGRRPIFWQCEGHLVKMSVILGRDWKSWDSTEKGKNTMISTFFANAHYWMSRSCSTVFTKLQTSNCLVSVSFETIKKLVFPQPNRFDPRGNLLQVDWDDGPMGAEPKKRGALNFFPGVFVWIYKGTLYAYILVYIELIDYMCLPLHLRSVQLKLKIMWTTSWGRSPHLQIYGFVFGREKWQWSCPRNPGTKRKNKKLWSTAKCQKMSTHSRIIWDHLCCPIWFIHIHTYSLTLIKQLVMFIPNQRYTVLTRIIWMWHCTTWVWARWFLGLRGWSKTKREMGFLIVFDDTIRPSLYKT